MNQLELMEARLGVRGGNPQQDRMIKDKRRSLDKALLYSYQGAKVCKLDSETTALALINPNHVKQDYDDKVISIGFEHEFKSGTIFEWVNTDTKWLIYLQDLTELAYFRGDIRRCTYQISWKVGEDIKKTYAAVTGPKETSIDTAIKKDISIDSPNYSLDFLLPASKEVLEYFRRYSKFYLTPLAEGDVPICWRVEATDSISMPGILQVSAVEYYSNETEDDIEQGIVDGKPQSQPQGDAEIQGETFIKPKKKYTYTYTGEEKAEWSFDQRLPIAATIEGSTIALTWTTTYSGQFILKYGDKEKTIVVESLF